MSPGSGSLKIDFVGELNDKMKGFYRSKYTTPGGEVRYAAVTQFEVSRCPNEVRPVAQLAICAPSCCDTAGCGDHVTAGSNASCSIFQVFLLCCFFCCFKDSSCVFVPCMPTLPVQIHSWLSLRGLISNPGGSVLPTSLAGPSVGCGGAAV